MEGTILPRVCAAILIAATLPFVFAAPDPPETMSALTFSNLQPNGGEVLPGGVPYDVSWNATHGNDTWHWATLAFSIDEGATYPYFINANTYPLPQASHPWQVPRFNTTAARVRVCGIASDGDQDCVASAGNFTITATLPYLDLLSPADDSVNVPLGAPFVFGMEGVDTGSLMLMVNPMITLFPSWSPDGRVLTLSHATPLAACTRYEITASVLDLGGNPLGPYAYNFTTGECGPFIVSTYPFDAQADVPFTDPITVKFNAPMNTTAVNWSITPTLALTPTWSENNTFLVLNHTTPFYSMTMFTVEVQGTDLAYGNPLIPGLVPNPWVFATSCAPCYIEQTDPADGEENVSLDHPITVWFSGPVDLGLPFDVLIGPPPGPLTLTWNVDYTILTIDHPPFQECTRYTVEIRYLELLPGPVPNPWSFTTICNSPYIVRIDLPIGLFDPIVVTFSEPMNTATVTWTIAPPIALTPSWSTNNTVLTLSHSMPFQECTMYTFAITGGQDLDGNPLVPGPYPNPITFMTGCPPPAPPRNVRLTLVAPSTLLLSWDAVPGAEKFVVYQSLDRFAPWPWAALVEVPGDATQCILPGVGDHLTHYFIVRVWLGGVESGNSTMAAKVEFDLAFDPAKANVHWISLPYETVYARASDIANDLTRDVVSVVSAWDPATQRSVLYFDFRGAWRGTDFAIEAGKGTWVGVAGTSTWTVAGTDRDVVLSFTPSAPGDRYLVSLPYGSAYRTVSDVVLNLEGSLGGTANTKITEILRWDEATQSVLRFYWTPSGWTGTDFAILSGESLLFRVVSPFNWTPSLVTPVR